MVTWVDPQGIGRDAKDNGGPPKPSLDEALSCHLDTLGFGVVEGCVGCICDACGSAVVRCNVDADCKALLDCRSSCQPGENCDEKCEPLMFEHSSAVGLITQVGTCIQAQCPQCAPKPDAGAS